jgi:hypothetical protein
METVATFIETIGRDAFLKATGHSQQVVSRAIAENVMPAGWYLNVRDLCQERQVAVPEHLFRWINKRKPSAQHRPEAAK